MDRMFDLASPEPDVPKLRVIELAKPCNGFPVGEVACDLPADCSENAG